MYTITLCEGRNHLRHDFLPIASYETKAKFKDACKRTERWLKMMGVKFEAEENETSTNYYLRK